MGPLIGPRACTGPPHGLAEILGLRPDRAQPASSGAWASGPALGARQRRELREWLSQKLPSKRHVFSAIYLLFNRKWAKNPCIRGRAHGPGLGLRPTGVLARESLSQKSLSKRHVFSAIYLLFNRKRPKNPCLWGGVFSLREGALGQRPSGWAQPRPFGLPRILWILIPARTDQWLGRAMRARAPALGSAASNLLFPAVLWRPRAVGPFKALSKL